MARAPIVFLTGASSGIGLALAGQYAAAGARLGLVARRLEPLQTFARAYPHLTIEIYAVDVRDTQALADAAADFIERVGCPDIVIANAGVSRGTVTGHGDLDAFRAVMDTNYLGTVATFEPFIELMTRLRRGTLVGIASVAGVRGLPGAGAYSASKAATISYLESLRVEMRGANVKVVTLAPGYIRTPMTAENDYRMPFLMDVDAFAIRALRAIADGRRFVVIPWPMGVVAALLRILPRALYDFVFARAPRKAR